MINLDAHQSVRQTSALLEEIMTTQSTCLPTTVARSGSIRRLVDAIYWWNFCRMMKVSLQPCCLSFKDFIQRLSDKQTEEHLLPRITSIQLIFSLHFHLSIETAIDFVFFTHFISEKEQDYNYSSSSVSEDSKQTIVYPKRLFGWTSLLCGYTLRLYISDCICQLLSARSHLCFVIDSNIVSRKRFLADFTFLRLKDNRFE